MKKSFELFKLDWQRIFKSPVAILLFIALLILPSLYCWFNVWALWDPYSNTSEMKVAVYSADAGTTFGDKKIEIGKELTTQLKENDQLNWTFVKSKKDVVEGVKSGEYYAGIYVPQQFSKNLLSFVDGQIKKPELEYYVNTKINAVAPKITDKGASTLQDTISNEFVTTVGKTMVGVFNKLGIDLDHNLPMLRRFSTMITMTNDNLPTIESYLSEVQTVHQKLPELEEKLNQANQLVGFIPEVNKFTNKVVEGQKYLPLIDDAGKMTLQLQQNIPAIYDAAKLMNTADQNFNQISETLDSGIVTLDKSAIFVTKLNEAMPEINQFSKDAEGLVNQTKDELIPSVQAALPIVQSTIDTGLTLITDGAQTVSAIQQKLLNLLDQLEANPNNAQIKQQILTQLNLLKETTASLQRISSKIADTLNRLPNAANDQIIQTAVTKLRNFAAINGSLNTILQDTITNFNNLSIAQLRDAVTRTKVKADQIQVEITNLINLNIPAKVSTFIQKLQATLTSASTTLEDINVNILPQVPGLLDSTKKTLTELSGYLKTLQKDMPLIQSTLHSTNNLFQNNLETIVAGINSLSGLYQNDYPALRLKLSGITSLIQKDLPRIENELTTAIALANEKLPEVKSGLNLADEFIKQDWPELKSGIQKGANAINKVEKSVNMDQLIELLKRDANKEANFLANPVQLKTNTLYPIPTYGSQSAPFYTALCIWVGALLLSSIISTDVVLDAKQKERYSRRHQFFGRYMTFLVVGLLQALIVSLGNMFLIHAYVKEPVLFVLSTMFIAFSFFSILYSLVALFGNIGKGLGIIILVLSISGAGGNFPVILSGQFFRAINPLLPFTYAVNGLRETVGGIYWPNYRIDLIFLAVVAIAFLVLCSIFLPKINPLVEKVHNNAKKSMIIH